MEIKDLPFEVLLNIFRHLELSDLLASSSVSKFWREVVGVFIGKKAVIHISSEIKDAINTISKSCIIFNNWLLEDLDLVYKDFTNEVWMDIAKNINELTLRKVRLYEKDFTFLIKPCSALKYLFVTDVHHLFMTGNLLKNEWDKQELSKVLVNVTSLELSYSRYLTDLLFYRMIFFMSHLENLSLYGCQISFQSAIYKRFYPKDKEIIASELVFTFQFILRYIEIYSAVIKSLNFSETGIDSKALQELAKVPDLSLESLFVSSCISLTNSGLECLCQNQKNIRHLDLSLCPRITDLGVITIANNLHRLQSLSLMNCKAVTEIGIKALAELHFLEKLNLAYIEVRTSECIMLALGMKRRELLKWLSLASLMVDWKTVVAISENVPNLEYFDLTLCTLGVNDKSVQSICKNLLHLRYLNLSGCMQISDIGLAGHSLSQNVPCTLDFVGMEFSLESMGLKSKDPYKVQLGLKAERRIREEVEVIKYLESNVDCIIKSSRFGLTNLKGLTYLNLCGCVRISDTTLMYSMQFLELKNLDISHCSQIGEESFINMVRNCQSLEILIMNECSKLTDNVILAISHYLKRIRNLMVKNCRLLTNDSLDSLSSCKTLCVLDISNCSKMTLEMVQWLKGTLHSLQKLSHYGIKSKGEKSEIVTIRRPPPAPPLIKKFRMLKFPNF